MSSAKPRTHDARLRSERATAWYGESFAKHRGRSGEFKHWMQVFCLRSKLGKNGAPIIDIMKIAPWVFEDTTIDREVLLSMYRLGVMKHLPAHWSQDEWDWLELERNPVSWSVHAHRYDEAREHSPIYAAICEGMSGPALVHHLSLLAASAGVDANTLAFWEAMRPLVIMPALSGALLPDVVVEAANNVALANSINQEIDR
jgi:hypothetical protein